MIGTNSVAFATTAKATEENIDDDGEEESVQGEYP
jgi:hypothetical protein